MQVEVFERADETLMVVFSTGNDAPLPRTCGPLVPLGTSDIDEAVLHPWVVERLHSHGFSAVVGDDAASVRRGMACLVPEPAVEPDTRWLGLIG